jgi:hypothetical protein
MYGAIQSCFGQVPRNDLTVGGIVLDQDELQLPCHAAPEAKPLNKMSPQMRETGPHAAAMQYATFRSLSEISDFTIPYSPEA